MNREASTRQPDAVCQCDDSYSIRVDHLTWAGRDVEQLYARAVGLLMSGGSHRVILGIAGAPASGKSTLACQLCDRLELEYPGRAALVGMDAFHLSQRLLERHGLADVKGAPQTFDTSGYLALLRRLREEQDRVYAPEFDRTIEDSIAQATEIDPGVGLIITEGNYLLLDRHPWRQLREVLDETWLITLDDDLRHQRLIARHQHFGRDQQAALTRTYGSDEQNAQLIDQASSAPDVMVTHLAGRGVIDSSQSVFKP